MTLNVNDNIETFRLLPAHCLLLVILILMNFVQQQQQWGHWSVEGQLLGFQQLRLRLPLVLSYMTSS